MVENARVFPGSAPTLDRIGLGLPVHFRFNSDDCWAGEIWRVGIRKTLASEARTGESCCRMMAERVVSSG